MRNEGIAGVGMLDWGDRVLRALVAEYLTFSDDVLRDFPLAQELKVTALKPFCVLRNC